MAAGRNLAAFHGWLGIAPVRRTCVRLITASVEFGVKYLTIYAFSTENWGRPKAEVQGLMHILEDVIDKELKELNEEGVQLRHIGRLERFKCQTPQKSHISYRIDKKE